MSFGSTGFGGFGSSTNQQSTPFTGFGANNNNTTTTGFGTATNTGFGGGNNNAGGSLFGGGGNTSGGFGSTGFGSTTPATSAFGSRPAFGAPASTSGGSLFGGTATTGTGFGGFGGTNNNNQASTGFGANNNTGGGLFGSTGQGQPAFGSSTGGGLFGSSAQTTTGFGQAAPTTTGFGQSATSGFGTSQNNNAAQNNGTGSTPFTAHIEKDAVGSAGQQHFQSIVCQPPYTNFQFEELRTADYNQGRKYSNQGGQPGAFGQSTGFGGGFGSTSTTTGFGQPSGGIFGAQSNSTPSTGAFGQPQNTGFGANNSSSNVFGAKPATGGLFGNTPSTSGQTGGGIFGTTGASTGFGSTSAGFGSTNTNTGGGLFGANQPKPAGLFGSSNTGTGFGSTTTGSFGQQTGTTGGLFGAQPQPAQSNAFGQPAQTSSPFGGGFGQNQAQQPQAQTNAFGQTGNAFGQQNQQQKPLFGGTSSTPTNLFGQNAQQPQAQASGGLFGGGSTSNQQGSSLFGGNQPKPGGLFGNATASSTTGGLFGNSQTQQPQSTNLFGQTNNTQNKGLFGSTTGNSSGTNLFGSFGQNNQPQQTQTGTSSLFGNPAQNQQSGLGASLLNNSQQQGPQQSQQLTTSINSNNPYGNEHLFVSLATPPQAVGPLATPLSSSHKPRARAPLPTYRINPAASSRLVTPQRKNGFGFDYSTYGTPGSAFSSTSPMYSRSLLGNGSFSRSLGKSLSTSNLRSSLSPEDSILAPGAFSAGGMRSLASGSLKKLKIDRNLRTDLFGTPNPSDTFRASPLKKTVSFDTEGTPKDSPTAEINGDTNNALVRIEEPDDSPTPSAEEQGYIRPTRSSRDKTKDSNAEVSQPESEQVKGNELAIVPEDETPSPPLAQTKSKQSSAADRARAAQNDMEPGNYYMSPNRAQLQKMSRKQLSNVSPFTVGRENAGVIEFDKVDLSDVKLDQICGDIVRIEVRSATVYADDAQRKPQPGHGLNFPARVTLDNSWPRSKGGRLPVYERKGPRFEKHLDRLRRVPNTEFINYDVETGQWIFRVSHFSTYTFDYSDDESMISEGPEAPSDFRSGLLPRDIAGDYSNASSDHGSHPDDTFEFRTSRSLPGAFDGDVISDDEMDFLHTDPQMQTPRKLTGGNQVPPDSLESSIFVDETQDLTDPVDVSRRLKNDRHTGALISPIKNSPAVPKSILKNQSNFGTPGKVPIAQSLVDDMDWASKLQHTLSPKKQDREALRKSQGQLMKSQGSMSNTLAAFSKESNPFATSIDVMNSLFGRSPAKGENKFGKLKAASKKSKLPHANRAKVDDNDTNVADLEYYGTFKPSWASDGVVGPAQAKAPPTIRIQRKAAHIQIVDGAPYASSPSDLSFAEFADAVDGNDPASEHEKLMWLLAAILFDNFYDEEVHDLSRKDVVSGFWRSLVTDSAKKDTGSRNSSEEHALIQLSAFDVWGATETLLSGRNFRLATMVSQMAADSTGGAEQRKDMSRQIDDWRTSNTLSEISPTIRAIYELLAGNTCTSLGKSGAGAENRAETFNISSRFHLDWRRSFGLRLWYGTTGEEGLAVAVERYVRDLTSYREEVRPVPWFVEKKINTGWEDAKREERQDILLGLLKIYALLREQPDSGYLRSRVGLADVISPLNITGNPWDNRLSFQLYQILRTKGEVDFAGDDDERTHRADVLTMDYACQISGSAEALVDALFVSLHLTDSTARQSAIKVLLNRYAGAIGESAESCPVFDSILNELKVPASWIWQAKALHARTVLKDDVQQCRCLINGDDLEQAHKVLIETVAPRCIIEEDRRALSDLLDVLVAHGADKLRKWPDGGAVYRDYLRLLQIGEKGGEAHEAIVLAREIAPKITELARSPILNVRVSGDELAKGIDWAVGVVRRRTGNMDVDFGVLPTRTTVDDAVLDKLKSMSQTYYAALVKV